MPKSDVFNIDCMAFMATLPDKFVDLAIVDPPYGIGGDSLHSNRSLEGAGKLKNRALNKLNTKWDILPPGIEYFNELFRVSKNQIIWGGNYFNLPPTRCIICWDKVQPWENFSQWEMAWTSFNYPSPIFKYDNRTGNKIHPTQKPVALYKWLLHNYAKPGDKILDTHMGSQSSRIACYDGGFDYWGCELDPDYFTAGCKRFDNHIAQLTIPL